MADITTIKTIPAEYDGTTFRSRTEARWAVFFDALGVQWSYEPEGYDLGESGWYLPDFWLPQLETFVEIKGVKPNEAEQDAAATLAGMTKKRVIMFWGPPSDSQGGYGNGNDYHNDGGYRLEADVWEGDEYVAWDNYYHFCVCGKCGRVGIEYSGYSERICGQRCHIDPHKGDVDSSGRLSVAIRKSDKFSFWNEPRVPRKKSGHVRGWRGAR